MSKISSTEKLLEAVHGDLHAVIPSMCAELGARKAAQTLHVNTSWLRRWLRDNGYKQVTMYIQENSGGAA